MERKPLIRNKILLAYKFFEFLGKKEDTRIPHKVYLLYKIYTGKKFEPWELKIPGSLYLTRTDINTLPDGLEIGGDFNLYASSIKVLPRRLKVQGNLVISETDINTLPEDMEIGGGILMQGAFFTELPDGLTLSGDLDISETGITQLPENLKIGGSLIMKNVDISTIPKSTEIGRDLIAVKSELTSIPDDIRVRYLAIGGTPLYRSYKAAAEKMGLDWQLSMNRIFKKRYPNIKEALLYIEKL